MIAYTFLAVLLATAAEPSHSLPGCLETPALTARLSLLRAAQWQDWSPAVLANTWPQRLEVSARDYPTNIVVGYRRPGRLIEGRVECGETYLFDIPSSPSGDRLREVFLSQAQLSRAEALSAAGLLIQAVDPPSDAGAAQVVCFDCGDPGEELTSRQWIREGEKNMLQVHLHPGVGSFVVDLIWSRRREH
jgi:hypothetical protein